MIKKLDRQEIENSLSLVWDVFCKYEAVNYPEDGKTAFWEAIHSDDYLNMLTAYGAFDNDRQIGIIATRSEGSHIALFFVDGDYHKHGIGRQLFNACMADNQNDRVTVHSSEYAVEVYKKLGFVQKGAIQESGGIRFVPMEFQAISV